MLTTTNIILIFVNFFSTYFLHNDSHIISIIAFLKKVEKYVRYPIVLASVFFGSSCNPGMYKPHKTNALVTTNHTKISKSPAGILSHFAKPEGSR